MEILLTKSEGVFKYIEIAERSFGLMYSGTIIYFRPFKDFSLLEKTYDASSSLPRRTKSLYHFFKTRYHEKSDEKVVSDKNDEIILSALGSVFSKIKMLACSQSEGKFNYYMERMVEGCKVATIYIHVVSKDGYAMDDFHIPLKMFAKDADSFDHYDASSFVYLLKADDNLAEITKNLQRISQTDFFSSENIF
jgi:hypothetical protein